MSRPWFVLLIAGVLTAGGSQTLWADHNPNHGGGGGGGGSGGGGDDGGTTTGDTFALLSESVTIDLGAADFQGDTAYGGSDDRVVVSNSLLIEGSKRYDLEIIYPSLCNAASNDDRMIFSPASGNQPANTVILAGLSVIRDGNSTLYDIDADSGTTSGNPNQSKCTNGDRELKWRNQNISGSSDTVEMYVTFRTDGATLSTSAGLLPLGANGELPAGIYTSTISTIVTFKGGGN